MENRYIETCRKSMILILVIMEIIPWEDWDPRSDYDFIKNFVTNCKDLEDFTK